MADLDKLEQIRDTLKKAAERKRFRAIDFFTPYDKQKAHFALGTTCSERLLMAGNQQGKTYAGAAEMAYHLTGQYPAWWPGRKWDRPVRAWAAGVTGILVRDGPQKLLCGTPGVDEDFGTGLIPRDCFVEKPTLARGVTNLYDTLQVKHYTNGVYDGISTLTFKSYEQGPGKFQSTTLDLLWLDEEPEMAVYSECLARFTATGGMLYMTFTPLMGMSDVVMRYLSEKSPDRDVTMMTIDDAKHIPPEKRQEIIDRYPAHERDARARGIPMLGSGRIFQIAEETIAEEPITYVPPQWFKLWAIDFGIGHPFAAVLLLWDKDFDVLHVHHCIRIADQLPLQHAVPMLAIGAEVPVAWPHDGDAREAGSGESLKMLYKRQKLQMLGEHATFPEGGYSTEAGIMEMQDRMRTGKLKVAKHLSDWWEEYRMYHRKDGLIVKKRDDLMSATRIGVMAKRYAKQVPLGALVGKGRATGVVTGVDFDYF